MKTPNLSIDKLQLDLRGLPRSTAEAVPGHLGKALQEMMSQRTLPQFSAIQESPELNLSLDRNDSAPFVARKIAEALIDSLQVQNPF